MKRQKKKNKFKYEIRKKNNWMNKWKVLYINMTQMNTTKGDTELQDICGTVYYI